MNVGLKQNNWQSIPFFVDILLAINPAQALDMRIGYGHWGMLVREFCDARYNRFAAENRNVQLEGRTSSSEKISPEYCHLYDKIHQASYQEIVATLTQEWNVIFFSNVLDQIEKTEALDLLSWALKQSDYVLVHVPLGQMPQHNDSGTQTLEKQLSFWDIGDFYHLFLRQHVLFVDAANRPFGSFVLSIHDPKKLSQGWLGSGSSAPAHESGALNTIEYANVMAMNQAMNQLQEQIRRVQVLRNELQSITGSKSYRFIQRLKQSPVQPMFQRSFNALSRLRYGYKQLTAGPVPEGAVRIAVAKNVEGAHQGHEVWLLAVLADHLPARDLLSIQRIGNWTLVSTPETPTGQSLCCAERGWADIEPGRRTRLLFMTHPWSGAVEISWEGQTHTIDLYSQENGRVIVDLYEHEIHVKRGLSSAEVSANLALIDDTQVERKDRRLSCLVYTPEGMVKLPVTEWSELVSQKPQPVAVLHPHWLGIHSSSNNLFDYLYEIDDTLDPKSAEDHARCLIETMCPSILIQGFPLTYIHLINALHRLKPSLPIYVIWHGNFLQAMEDYAWKGLQTIIDLCKEKKIAKLGFVKKGMAETVSCLGVPASFIMNRAREIPDGPSVALPDGPHLGIWTMYNHWPKPPYAMLGAARLIPGAVIHTIHGAERVKEFNRYMDLETKYYPLFPQSEMRTQMAQMNLNLYITFSECAPMLPLESLAAGSPCLLGPVSYYFDDNSYLYSRLVVPTPDSTLDIAHYIEKALAERDEIINCYRAYAPGYNERVGKVLADFLEFPIV